MVTCYLKLRYSKIIFHLTCLHIVPSSPSDCSFSQLTCLSCICGAFGWPGTGGAGGGGGGGTGTPSEPMVMPPCGVVGGAGGGGGIPPGVDTVVVLTELSSEFNAAVNIKVKLFDLVQSHKLFRLAFCSIDSRLCGSVLHCGVVVVTSSCDKDGYGDCIEALDTFELSLVGNRSKSVLRCRHTYCKCNNDIPLENLCPLKSGLGP